MTNELDPEYRNRQPNGKRRWSIDREGQPQRYDEELHRRANEIVSKPPSHQGTPTQQTFDLPLDHADRIDEDLKR